jgi:hypothetical protein
VGSCTDVFNGCRLWFFRFGGCGKKRRVGCVPYGRKDRFDRNLMISISFAAAISWPLAVNEVKCEFRSPKKVAMLIINTPFNMSLVSQP